MTDRARLPGQEDPGARRVRAAGTVPEGIEALLPPGNRTMEEIGCSCAGVQIFSDRVLKIEPAGEDAENEVRMLLWLREKPGALRTCSAPAVTVPGVLAHEVRDGLSFLLMEKCPGRMACGEESMADPPELARLLAEALKILWSVDLSDCPSRGTDERALALAGQNVREGKKKAGRPGGCFGGRRLNDPAALLSWLQEHRPPVSEPVLSHGDFSLPNIFLFDHAVAGYIDVGRMGTGDRWYDIAVCWRSLRENYRGKYRRREYPGYTEDALFRALGDRPDRERIRYDLLLEELL